MDTLGQRIFYLRKINGLTQKQLAAATGLQRGNLSHYEKDKIKPAAEAVIALAGFFNVSTDWLLTGKDSRSKDATAFMQLNKKERLEVERYIEFLLWKRDKVKDNMLFVAEDVEAFDE